MIGNVFVVVFLCLFRLLVDVNFREVTKVLFFSHKYFLQIFFSRKTFNEVKCRKRPKEIMHYYCINSKSRNVVSAVVNF
jgi:hypothetical protein